MYDGSFFIGFVSLRMNSITLYTLFTFVDADVLVIMVTNETQAESVLYGDSGAVSGKYSLKELYYLGYLLCIFSSFFFSCFSSLLLVPLQHFLLVHP